MVEDRKIVNSKTLTFFPDITHRENVIPKSRKPSGARQKWGRASIRCRASNRTNTVDAISWGPKVTFRDLFHLLSNLPEFSLKL